MKATITLDERQISKITQIIIDDDDKAALLFLKDISKKINTGRAVCDPIENQMRESLNNIIDPSKQ